MRRRGLKRPRLIGPRSAPARALSGRDGRAWSRNEPTPAALSSPTATSSPAGPRAPPATAPRGRARRARRARCDSRRWRRRARARARGGLDRRVDRHVVDVGEREQERADGGRAAALPEVRPRRDRSVGRVDHREAVAGGRDEREQRARAALERVDVPRGLAWRARARRRGGAQPGGPPHQPR